MATTPAKATFPLILEDTYVRQDEQGRFSLNDLHQAAGGEEHHKPSRFTRTDTFTALVEALRPEMASDPVVAVSTGKPGTYVARELVYAYAMWISPSFHLKVIRVFKEYATNGMVMKPEVAKQAFDDPKVFMAKALMLAQETAWGAGSRDL